jgi:phosphoribosyl 1,2-cyclic phosphodiesterase
MTLKIISSSSSGNCYLLSASTGEVLIIECGVKIMQIKQALMFDLSNTVGVLVSHEHKDHCSAVKDVIACGLNVYASEGTIKGMGVVGHRIHVLQPENQIKLGGFKIKPFDAVHDCRQPFNFLIEHEECGRVVFITDTIYCHYTFPGLTNIIIEANYSQEILDNKVRNGDSPEFLRNRVIQSHMNLDTCKEFLRANDLRSVNNIVLIHLSDSNSNAEVFKKEISQLTLKKVHVAEKNMIIPFDKTPF